MKLNYKKRALLILLSAILSTSGCKAFNEVSKEDALVEIENIMNEESIKVSTLEIEKKYSIFYKKFISIFLAYMSEEQYSIFINDLSVRNEYGMYEPKKVVKHLVEVIGNADTTSYGNGVYHFFVESLLDEAVDLSVDFEKEKNIKTLRTLVQNDEEFYSSLFSGDINKFIDCIATNTYISSRSLVEELILIMNLYVDTEIDKYIDETLKENYKKRMDEIINMLTISKLSNDPKFAKSLCGKLLSRKLDGKNYTILQSLGENTFFISNVDDENEYSFNVDSAYILSDQFTIEDVKKQQVENLIKKSYSSDDPYTYGTYVLLLHLIDPSIFNDPSIRAEERRVLIYEDLSEYFTSLDEFDTFVLSLDCHSEKFTERYFEIFSAQLRKNGITHDDFLRYLSLSNFIYEFDNIWYDIDIDKEYPPKQELKKMHYEEYKNIIRTISHNFLVDSVDYHNILQTIANDLSLNDLGYKMVYEPSCSCLWKDGTLTIGGNEELVISSLVYPKKVSYGELTLIYYEYPENYEDGKAVDVFYNIEKRLTIDEIGGVKQTIIDEITGDEKNIFIVSFDENIWNYGPIRFMEYYIYFNKKQEKIGKKLQLGDDYE